MKQLVFINGRFLTQRVTGVQRYAREALCALDRRLAEGKELGDVDFCVLAPTGTESPALQAIDFKTVGRRRGNAWEQWDLPRAAGAQLLLSFSATGPLLKKNQLVTVHDASVFAVPQAFSRGFRAWYHVLLRVFARRHPMLLTVSHFSKGELSRYLKISEEKFRITTEGYQHMQRVEADAGILDKHGLVPGKFVLAVSSMTPNKNYSLIVDAMQRLNRPDFLVAIAGGQNASVFGSTNVPQFPFVRTLGYVTDGELRALYENASLFLYPSLYEGFGIPALEAMASGCPVIASNSASVPEVCEDAVSYVSPHDAPGLSQEITELMADAAARERLAEQGKRRVQRYSWDECARLNVQYVRERLGLSPSEAHG